MCVTSGLQKTVFFRTTCPKFPSRWVHLNKGANYCIQGWKKGRVYPDFIFARERTSDSDRIFVWEMKGDQLEGNLDTEYKRKLLATVSDNFKAEQGVKAGTLELVGQAGESVLCELVLLRGWKTEFARRMNEYAKISITSLVAPIKF